MCVNCRHHLSTHEYVADSSRPRSEDSRQPRPCRVLGCDCRSVTHLVATWVGYVRGSDPANGKDQCTFLVHRKQDPPEQGEEIVGHGKSPKARYNAALLEYQRRQSGRSA